jgi:tRNA pseudouridine38-40 synthase
MMVEAAMLCAREEMTLEQLIAQIECQEKHTSKLAPPEGLYLANVQY